MLITNTPTISIITVVYNGALYLENTIQNVVNQTYSNIEFIIVDGGSSDGTMNIVKRYSNKITKWVSEPDKGIYDAMNKGITFATGDWIIFMNAGDTFVDMNVLTKVAEFTSNQKADIIFGNVAIISNDDTKTVRVLKNTLPFLLRKMICHQCIFYSKPIFGRMGNYDTQFKFIADFAHLMRARFSNMIIKKIDLVISNYRLDGVSAKPENLKKIWKERMLIFENAGYMPLPLRWFFWLYAKAAYEFRRIFK